MDRSFILVPAPALGPATWQPVAAELRALGDTALTPTLAGLANGSAPFLPQILRRVGEQLPLVTGNGVTRDGVVLVAHSGAGVLLPYIADRLGLSGASVIFADAALPAESGPGAMTDAGFLPFLRGIARDGILPPWPQWWAGEDLSPLYPDDGTRRAVETEAPALPLAFFEERLPEAPASWRSLAKGFLRFSEPYEALADDARSRGWPVRELSGGHLHMLVRPREVADELRNLAAELASPG